MIDQIEIKKEVIKVYGGIAKSNTTGCSFNRVCDFSNNKPISEYSETLGYSSDEVKQVVDGANLGLGCGNPTAIASLKKGEVVIDLGSGGGFDCFLAAKKVGPSGRVIGVDMTQDMIDLARKNATKGNYTNVEFKLGEIEKLPVEDSIADAIISNCVVNLSPDKESVFREAARVLKKGGRIAISDLVSTQEVPESIRKNFGAYTGCIGGAILIDELQLVLERVGFGQIDIKVKPESREYIANWAPGSGAENYVASADIHATKI
jgi:arsenite methyltransferase